MLDTASQRPATGLNAEARELLLRVSIWSPGPIVRLFFADLYASYDDYYAAVGDVWGAAAADQCRESVATYTDAALRRQGPLASSDWATADYAALGLLRVMPEPDFRRAVHDALRAAPPDWCEERVTEICRRRGAPWVYSLGAGFEWIGDAEVDARAIQPALTAIADSRFAGGVKAEFDAARSELALGTPVALSQSVHQAGCAVESAMKVLLTDNGVAYGPGDTAQPLFDHIVVAGVAPREMDRLVLGAATPRNRWGGHGAGATAHAVTQAEAEAVLASAAVAISYLHTLLT
jgi:hypothetical protein